MLKWGLVILGAVIALRVVTAPAPTPPPEPVRQVAAASALAGAQLDARAAWLGGGGQP